MTIRNSHRSLSLFMLISLLFVVLAACQETPPVAPPPTEGAEATEVASEAPTSEPVDAEPTTTPTDTPQEAPSAEATAPATTTPPPTATAELLELPGADLPPAVPYNLGDSTVIQARFPEDTNFRNMPVRLDGVIAVPESNGQPAPVVLILHGNHPGCPFVESRGIDVWPCDPEDEQDNYLGFSYLVSELAARGYVSLSINMNAQYTLGFGEETGSARARQLIEQHLTALAEATAGGGNAFGVELAGAADLGRLTFIGHSQGGEMANWLAREQGWDQPESYATNGFGPVKGILMVAPSRNFVDSGGSNAPIAVILPECDGDVVGLDGQSYYEIVRLDPAYGNVATTTLLKRSTHNAFNTILAPDWPLIAGADDCELPLAGDVQRNFLVDYAADFLALLNSQPDQQLESLASLGLDATLPVPDSLYGLPVLLSALTSDRKTLLTPFGDAELSTSLAGGIVIADGVDLTFCPEGYFDGSAGPDLENCRRRSVSQPANPQMAVLSWNSPEAEWRFEVPEEAGDFSAHTALSLRAVPDPLSPLNEAGTGQSFAVRLTDQGGQSVVHVITADEPALQLAPSEPLDLDGITLFPGHSYMSTIRIPLTSFEEVDLSSIREVAFLFDQIDRGTLFLGDIELVRPPQIIGAYSTLIQSTDASSEP